jgi:NAD(P)-dependent dehydrogenase (short-subunit alcohol dehydrogenase family)
MMIQKVQEIRFDGQVAIITGAGNGLGKDYALELARRGAKVVVNDLGGTGSGEGRSTTAADNVVAQIRAAGGEAVANYASVANRAGAAAIVQDALDNWGRLDICISNAGILRNNRFEDLTDAQIDAVLDVHLKGAFYIAQPAYRVMRAQGYGRILFTASASGVFGHAWQANYGAAKAAMVGLSNVVALEGADYGITSNVILPTSGDTRLAQEMDPGFMEISSFATTIGKTDWAPEGRGTIGFNTPLALYLVSHACTTTHGIFSSSSGRYARVGIVPAQGWVAPAGPLPPSVEQLAANFDQICAVNGGAEPTSVYEEISLATRAGRDQGVYL